MTGMNSRCWNSSNHGKEFTKEQHKAKKWFLTNSPMRTKLRWNKKRGIREKTKKGSHEDYFWVD